MTAAESGLMHWLSKPVGRASNAVSSIAETFKPLLPLKLRVGFKPGANVFVQLGLWVHAGPVRC